MSYVRIRQLTRRVGFRLTLLHAGIFAIGGVLVFSVAYLQLKRGIDEQTRDTIEFRLSQFAAEYHRGGTPAVIELCKVRIARSQKAFFVRLATPENQTVFLRDADEWAEFQPQLLEGARPPSENIDWIDLNGPESSLLQIASMHLPDRYILQVGKTLELREQLLRRFQYVLAGVAAVGTIAGAIGAATVAHRALSPVLDLTATVRSIMETGKFASRVPARGTGDEIDELVQCFNGMLQKIDGLIRGMRESLDNVAHDLRTPITRLRNVASKALERDADKAASHAALEDCLEETERVTTMLLTLMDIAEAEAGAMRLEKQPVEVARLAQQAVDLYEHVAEEKEIALSVQTPAGLRVEADAGRLLRALANLVDNAIKYTPPGGRVAIRGSRDDQQVRIEVADSGEGIPESELMRIWERLYRVDKSRSQRGLGLGLSFVKAIAEAHGGQTLVASAVGKGSVFTIQLPCGEAEHGTLAGA